MSEKPCKGRLNKTYVRMYVCVYMCVCVYVCIYVLLIITRVQASGVIIDRLLQQCCFVCSEIEGPHSSGNFNYECGPTIISDHTKQHCRNKRSVITPEA